MSKYLGQLLKKLKVPNYENVKYELLHSNFEIFNISPEMVGENRIHQCGRADALTNFKALILEERKTARIKAGLTPE